MNELNNIILYAQQEKWDEAEGAYIRLEQTWGQAKFLLAFNYAEADYSLFIDNISRIQGAIKTQDDTETISQSISMLNLWNNFIKPIPQP